MKDIEIRIRRVGVLIAALTLGSSLPHFLLLFTSDVSWKAMIVVSSLLALVAAAIMQWVLPDVLLHQSLFHLVDSQK